MPPVPVVWPAIVRWGPPMPPVPADGLPWPGGGLMMPRCLRMAYYGQVGASRCPRNLRMAYHGQVRAYRCPAAYGWPTYAK